MSGLCDEPVRLRRASESDARGIAEVHIDTWRAAYRDQLPPAFLAGLSVDNRERMWKSELGVLSPDRRPWVAVAGTQIVGFVSTGAARDEDVSRSDGEVYAIYVLPECWERGVGRRLLAHAERDLHSHGYTHAVLWCLTSNSRGRTFYEQLGWRTDGATKQRDVGGRQVEEVRYRIALDKSRFSGVA